MNKVMGTSDLLVWVLVFWGEGRGLTGRSCFPRCAVTDSPWKPACPPNRRHSPFGIHRSSVSGHLHQRTKIDFLCRGVIEGGGAPMSMSIHLFSSSTSIISLVTITQLDILCRIMTISTRVIAHLSPKRTHVPV